MNDEHRVDHWPRHERTAWWQLGHAFMQRLGYLDVDGKPTWKRGAWPSKDELIEHRARVQASCRVRT